MAEFTAYQAAVLADDVYALTRLSTLDQAMKYLKNEHGEVFTFGEQNMLKGRTGGPGIIKCRTAFGFTLLGQGKLTGHAVILFRGTQYLADWLTNLNISVSRSASGQPLHDGFNRAFKSMEPKLAQFMAALASKQVHSIHCIGHSLGGALATICGDWVSSSYPGLTPYVYTYGSPRVGLHAFAACCTKNIGAERIFRAYHKTDIVPCIPIWPYIHTPSSGRDYYLPSPGIVPMAEYHGMDHYIDSVIDRDWDTLAGLREAERDDNSIANWLKDKTPIGLTITSIEWLNRALVYVLEKCLNGAAWVISKAATTSLTLMDRLAYILQKGVNIAETTSSWVLYLMRKILQVLGMNRVVETADLTHHFIRSVLINLQQKINQYVQSVLSKILVKGRAV